MIYHNDTPRFLAINFDKAVRHRIGSRHGLELSDFQVLESSYFYPVDQNYKEAEVEVSRRGLFKLRVIGCGQGQKARIVPPLECEALPVTLFIVSLHSCLPYPRMRLYRLPRLRARRSGAELLKTTIRVTTSAPMKGHASLSGLMLDSMILCQTLTLRL